MSRELFSHNPDLKRLLDEGYFVQQQGGHLVMREVHYTVSKPNERSREPPEAGPAVSQRCPVTPATGATEGFSSASRRSKSLIS